MVRILKTKESNITATCDHEPWIAPSKPVTSMDGTAVVAGNHSQITFPAKINQVEFIKLN